MKITINNKDKSEIEIIGTLEKEVFMSFENKALEHIGARVEVQGFRPGKATVEAVKEHINNDMMILEEMAEHAIQNAYPQILEEHKIDAIGRPMIAITKIARNEDLEFKIHTAILPRLELPDYKKISKEQKEKNPVSEVIVAEAEIEKTILELRKMRAQQALPKHEHEDGDAHEHNHEEIKEEDYPAFDDEFAKSFGNFQTADEFKNKISENLKIEKETEGKDKLRLAIIESILEKTNGDIPEILIESEIEKILYKLEADITNMGFKFEDYLVQIKKTVDELKKEWRSDAEKRAKLQIVINQIAKNENLKVDEEQAKKETEAILKMYKEADPIRARAYVENMLENEKVFGFLEK